MTTQANKTLIKRLFAELWSQPTVEKLDAFYHQDLDAEFDRKKVTFDDVKNRVDFCQKRFTHIDSVIKEMIAEDDKVFVLLDQTAHGQQPEHTEQAEIAILYWVRDGRISKIRAHNDLRIDYYQTA